MYKLSNLPVARPLKLVALGLLTLALIAIFVVPRLRLGKAFQRMSEREGRDLIYDAFGSTLEKTVAYLGEPDAIQDLRENEQLVYWNFDPVNLQIHFYKGRASRLGYLTKDAAVRANLSRRIREYFGKPTSWTSKEATINGEVRSFFVNPTARLSLVEENEGIYLYSYILR